MSDAQTVQPAQTDTTAGDPGTAGSDDRSRWLALYVLCTGMLMVVLDATIVNVALPSIQEDLGFSQSGLAWVVNAYLIAFGGLLLLAGRVGDLIGQRRMFLIGTGVFTVASLLCAVSFSEAWLVGARFVQGVGGALTSAVILGMIINLFPEPRDQAKAIAQGVGLSVGAIFSLEEGVVASASPVRTIAAADAGAATRVEPGLVEVTANVTLEAELSQ